MMNCMGRVVGPNQSRVSTSLFGFDFGLWDFGLVNWLNLKILRSGTGTKL